MSKFKKITATILAASMLIPSISAEASTKKYIEDVSISSKVEVLITADSAKFDSLVSMLDAKSNDISAKFTEISFVDGVATLSDAETEKDNLEATPNDAAPEVKYEQFKDRAVATVDGANKLNIRKNGSEDAEIVGHLASGGICLVGETKNGWTFIQSGNCEGYVKTEYLAFGDDAGKWCEANGVKLKGEITADSLRVRAEANIDSQVLTLVPGGESYEILSQDGDWSYISVDGDVKGYVSTEYLNIKFATTRATTVAEEIAAEEAKQKALEEAAKATETPTTEATTAATEAPTEAATEAPADGTTPATEVPTTEAPKTEAPTTEAPAPTGGNVALGQQIANFALQYVGNPYVYGGSSLTKGADCSGFTMAVYAQFGYKLPHETIAQSKSGYEVPMSALQPGDLIYYLGSSGLIGHVALYTGNGMVVHASSPSAGIKTSVYNYRTPYKAIRIIK